MFFDKFSEEIAALQLDPVDPHSLGRYITYKREEKNMTPNALAVECEISRNEIIRIETGQRKQPSLNNLKKIAMVLNIRYDNLLYLAGYVPKDINGQNMDIRFHYPGLSDKQVAIVEDIIRLITDHKELTDEDLDDLVKHLKLLIAARKAE